MDSENDGSEAYQLVNRLARIPDMRQRGYALALRLQTRNDELVLDVIGLIRDNAMKGQEDFLRLYNSVLVPGVMSGVLGQERISGLVEAAQSRGQVELVAILLDPPAEHSSDTYHQPYLDGALREVPLGMRKSLARKPDFKMIGRIAGDQDHRVIEHLLSNPRLTERDVVRIAAVRPISPKVLEVIYKHPRWMTRYSVKKTIVLNPHSPLSIALRLLAFLNPADLEEVSRSPQLHPKLVQEAGRILAKKYQPPEREWTIS
jgi:hypothetical protein